MATIYSLDYRVRILESKIHKLYCYLKDNGGGGPETDPIFSASPAATITLQDIANWNAGGAVPNLQQVTNQGFTTSNPLISEAEVIGETIGVRVD
uniref:hypothetical protein n=1 Tax=Klebsiella pneumoniae TaxID=573 RepID=UPI001C596C45